jgi:hypothetical protein
MFDLIRKNFEEPRVAIGSDFEPVKRFPRLQVYFLHEVFALGLVACHAHSRSEEFVEMGQGRQLKVLWCNCLVDLHKITRNEESWLLDIQKAELTPDKNRRVTERAG